MADVTEMPAMPADAGAARAGGDGTTTAGERVTEGKASPSDPSAVTGRVGGEAMGDAGGPGTAGTGDQDNATGDANGKHATPTVTYKEGTKDHTQVGASPTPSTTVDGKTVVLSEIFFDPENPEEDDDDEEMDEGDRELGEQLVDVGGDAAAAAKPGGDSGTPGVRRRSVQQSAHITQEELSGCFHLPSEAACRKLGIGLTVLKRQCRKYGIKRWPFRKMKSLDRLITNVQAGISPGDQNRVLVKSVEELEEQKQRMQECHELDLDENTKRLQQAYSKANHKARRMAHQTDMGGVGGLLALSGGDGASGSQGVQLQRQASLGEKSIIEVLEAAKAQAELLQGVAATIPALLPGNAASQAQMAAAVAAAAAAMTQKSGGVGGSAASFASLTQAQISNPLAALGVGLPQSPSDTDTKNPTDAVVGRWSPARPVTTPWSGKKEPTDHIGHHRQGMTKDEWDEFHESRSGRKRKPSARALDADVGAKRSKKGKDAEVDDDGDPLASLAAAALAVKGKVPGRGRGRPPGSKNLPKPGLSQRDLILQQQMIAAGLGGFGAVSSQQNNASGFNKRAVTLLVTEHADRIREALMATVTEGIKDDEQSETKELLTKKINEVVGVESLKLRDALNTALAFLNF